MIPMKSVPSTAFGDAPLCVSMTICRPSRSLPTHGDIFELGALGAPLLVSSPQLAKVGVKTCRDTRLAIWLSVIINSRKTNRPACVKQSHKTAVFVVRGCLTLSDTLASFSVGLDRSFLK